MPATSKRRVAPRAQRSSSVRKTVRASRSVGTRRLSGTVKLRSRSTRTVRKKSSTSATLPWSSLSGIWPILIWTALSVLAVLLIYRTLLPVVLQNEWLAGGAVSEDRVILLSSTTQPGWVVVFLPALTLESSTYWVSPDQLRQQNWLEYPLDVPAEEGETQSFDAARVLTQLISDKSRALLEINQNTGIAFSDVLLVEAEQWEPINKPAETRQAISRSLRSAQWGLGWRDMVLNARIWYSLQGFRSIQQDSVDRVSLGIQTKRRSSAQLAVQNCTVALLNGTRISGLSARMSRLSEQQGFTVVRVGQAEELSEFSQLIISPEQAAECQSVSSVLLRFLPSSTRVSEEAGLTAQYRSPIVVVLGSDVGKPAVEP